LRFVDFVPEKKKKKKLRAHFCHVCALETWDLVTVLSCYSKGAIGETCCKCFRASRRCLVSSLLSANRWPKSFIKILTLILRLAREITAASGTNFSTTTKPILVFIPEHLNAEVGKGDGKIFILFLE
jgi:hypothetical protein